jgi:hypothetical protein
VSEEVKLEKKRKKTKKTKKKKYLELRRRSSSFEESFVILPLDLSRRE